MNNRKEIFHPSKATVLLSQTVKSTAFYTVLAFSAKKKKLQKFGGGRGEEPFNFFFNACLLLASPSVVTL